MNEDELSILGPYLTTGSPATSGEWRMHCPFHGEDINPSASLNMGKRVWSCRKCMESGTLSDLIKRVRSIPEANRRKGGAKIYDLKSKESASESSDAEYIHEGLVQMWHENLMDDSAKLAALINKRGLTLETIRRFSIGWSVVKKDRLSRRRYSIPVYDKNGELVNIRYYSMAPTAKHKIVNAKGHGSPPRLYPFHSLEAQEILVVEGEWDALIGCQNGFSAITGTHGARTWYHGFTEHFRGKDVYLCYDNDEEGDKGSQIAANVLKEVANSVRILSPLSSAEGSDLTDYFLNGGTAERLREEMESGRLVVNVGDRTKGDVLSVNVSQSVSSPYIGHPLQLDVSIVGRIDPPFDIPREIHLQCPISMGAKCQHCQMAEWTGYQEVEFENFDDKDVAMFTSIMTGNKGERDGALRKRLGIWPRCPVLEEKVVSHFVGEELYIQSAADRVAMEETDRSKRRVFFVSDKKLPVRINTSASLTGLNVVNSQTGRMDFVSWDLHEAITNIDTFTITPELRKSLEIFQPRRGQRPLSKCREIAFDLSRNVTSIWDRERMHMLIDLTWHSLLQFSFHGVLEDRGWLETLIVGDTRTGKSQAAQRLSEHYQSGRIINCERTSVAGLIGGVNKIGDRHVITWGDIPLQDRRLVILDEASGLSHEMIAQMSDVRTRGIAQIVKIETSETTARCRMIWISNPRPGREGPRLSYRNILGINMVQELIGNPEDIARFDLAMSVSSDDVPDVNDLRDPVPHVYTSELCHELIVWAWSRKPGDLVWQTGVEDFVLHEARRLGGLYEPSPPLIQSTDVRKKIARIAVAIAARTFSTDEIGEKVIVRKVHVEDAVSFIDKLYSYERFGYRQISNDLRTNRTKARKSRKEIVYWLKTEEGHNALEFLFDQNQASFRPTDLNEVFASKYEGEDALRRLLSAKMLRRRKSQLEMEPELLDILRELRNGKG